MMIFWLIIPALLDCLNLFWFRKMVLGVLKALNTKDVDENAEPKPRKRDQIKTAIKNQYVNFKSIIMRRKPEILRRRPDWFAWVGTPTQNNQIAQIHWPDKRKFILKLHSFSHGSYHLFTCYQNKPLLYFTFFYLFRNRDSVGDLDRSLSTVQAFKLFISAIQCIKQCCSSCCNDHTQHQWEHYPVE